MARDGVLLPQTLQYKAAATSHPKSAIATTLRENTLGVCKCNQFCCRTRISQNNNLNPRFRCTSLPSPPLHLRLRPRRH